MPSWKRPSNRSLDHGELGELADELEERAIQAEADLSAERQRAEVAEARLAEAKDLLRDALPHVTASEFAEISEARRIDAFLAPEGEAP